MHKKKPKIPSKNESFGTEFQVGKKKKEKNSGRIPMQVHFQSSSCVCLLGFTLLIGELEALFDQIFDFVSAQFKAHQGDFRLQVSLTYIKGLL